MLLGELSKLQKFLNAILVIAIEQNRKEIVESLIEDYGFDLNSMGFTMYDDNPPLTMSSLLALAEHKINDDGDEYTPKEYTPLGAALFHNNLEMVQYLCEQGANVNYQANDMGILPLTMANDKRMFEILIQYGGNIHEPDVDNVTPLMHAVMNRDIASIQYLCQCGADINQRSLFGKTPIEHVSQSFNPLDLAVIQYFNITDKQRILVLCMASRSVHSTPYGFFNNKRLFEPELIRYIFSFLK